MKAPEPISEEKRAAKAAADRIREAEAEASRVRRALAQVVVREKAGILLRQGYLQIEPSFSYSHSSRDRLDVAGLNIIDAVFVGVQDVEQVERDGFTSSLGIRYGIFDDLQFGMTIPFDWSSEDVFRPEDIERVPVPREVIDENDGAGIGDISFALSYHFFPETRFIPDLVASLGYKTKSGESPYDAGRDGIATGSGHQGLRTGISFVKASEPAIIFGSAGYFFSLPEKNIFDTRTGTEFEEIDPGDTFSYSIGLAFSLNWNLSISASIEHSIGSRTELKRVLVDGRRRRTFSFSNPRSETNAAVLRFGMTYALGGRTSMDFNVGVGLTRDAPDVILSTSMPVTLNANEYVRRIKLPRLWRD